MEKVAIYARVSTAEQVDGYSIGAQLEKLRKYCDIKGWIIYDEYVDGGFSGGSLERPAMKKLIKDAKNKKIDMVLCYKLDRISRSQKDVLYLIEDIFNKNNVKFSSLQENFDTSTALGMAMVGILSVFAQLERAQIRERMALGAEARAGDGLWHGGGYDPIGYDYIPAKGEKGGGQLIINEHEAFQIRKIYDMFEAGCSINEIRVYMSSRYKTKYGSWRSTSSIYSVLETPVVCGKIKFKDSYIEGKHEAIIPIERFERVQVLLKERRKITAGTRPNAFAVTSLLGGLLFCGNCGARYYIKTANSGRKAESKKLIRYYTCYSRGKTKKSMIMDPDCKNITIREEKLDQMIIDQILKLQLDPEQIDDIPEPNDNTEVIKKKLKELNSQKTKLMDLYIIGNFSVDEIQKRSEELDRQIKALEEDLENEYESQPLISIADAKEHVSNASDIFEHGTYEEKSKLIRYLIDQIILFDDRIEIHWTFE